MKRKIKTIIENNKILKRMYIYYFNKVDGEVEVDGMNLRGNEIHLSETSILEAKKDCELTNNRILVDGKNNKIEIGKNVCFTGNIKQGSILVFGDNNTIIVDDDCRITYAQFFIRGNNNIIHISKNCSATHVCFHIESDQFKVRNTIEVGKGTTIHGREEREVELFLDEGTTVKINEDCMLSNNISIRTTDSHSVIDKDGKRINQAEDVEIGRHCWIGAGVTILKGVTIAENNVVAAGSICTKTFEKEGTIIAGIPAKVVKKDVNWCRKQIK